MCDHDYKTSYILKEAAWFQVQEDLLSLFKSKTCSKTNAHVLSMTPGSCFIEQDGFGYLGPDHLPKCHPNFGVQINVWPREPVRKAGLWDLSPGGKFHCSRWGSGIFKRHYE